MQHDYRPAPALVARLMGLALAGLGVVLLVLLLVAWLLDLPLGYAVLPAAVLLFVLGAVGLHLLTRATVLRFTDQGYRLRFVRGAGVTRARWADVEDAVTTHVAGSPCIVLRLRDGGSTTIPVDVLAGDREELIHVVQAALDRGHGLRRLK
ncbi:hypothetical protein ACOACO_04010 [Nocardioides sp. CPCC 205120]|uniref:hypothetical protein n=1 Tax=Nocardioides sp. CPCC 205120 TaxID=3406462 RepID=UPI003B501D3D